jgi:hypothetical protein
VLPYPGLKDDRWTPAYSVPTVGSFNQSRTPSDPGKLPTDWHGYDPKFRRAELQCFVGKLDDDTKRAIISNAASREDFHDYDKIHNPTADGWVGFNCLCELRFITGSHCLKNHLIKGEDGNTVATPGNPHWAWSIDIAPRGFVCPRVWESFHI